jgi:hypothetical protein
MSILKKHFLINTQILLFQNQLFLNNINFTKLEEIQQYLANNESLLIYYFYIKQLIKNPKTPFKSSINDIVNDIVNDRKTELEKLSNIDNRLYKEVEIIDNKTGEISKIKNFNVVNNFKKTLLDNRFISHILAKENKQDSLFITLTTKKTSLNDEINELEEMNLGIKKILKKHKIKYCKVYELTKKLVPHIHLLIFNQDIHNKIKEYLKDFNNRTQILKIDKNDISKIVNYCSKNINNIDKSLIGFNQFLKNKKVKLFSSSISNSFEKKQRSILFTAYKIHLKYAKKNKDYLSEDFIDFCFKYVKNPLKDHNLHLKNSTPHFYIVKLKIFHSSNLQVFSRFGRISEDDKKNVNLTHQFIINFSKILLNKKTITKINIFINLFNFYYLHIINYIVNTKIIIIKPPP